MVLRTARLGAIKFMCLKRIQTKKGLCFFQKYDKNEDDL